MKTKLSSAKKLHPYRMLLGLGLGIGSMTVAMPAHASTSTQGCDATAASRTANFSSVQVGKELAFLRRLDLHDNLGFGSSKLLLADAACTASCGADGSANYSQSAGCTYTQTCGGKPTA